MMVEIKQENHGHDTEEIVLWLPWKINMMTTQTNGDDDDDDDDHGDGDADA